MDGQTKGNVVVGAIVSFVFVGYSGMPLIGGAVAGYLEGTDLRSGAVIGVMAGLGALAAILVLSVGTVLLDVDNFALMDILWEGILDPVREWGIPLVVLPLVGGGIGAYVRRETDG